MPAPTNVLGQGQVESKGKAYFRRNPSLTRTSHVTCRSARHMSVCQEVAVVSLPLTVPLGFHALWVDAEAAANRPDARTICLSLSLYL